MENLAFRKRRRQSYLDEDSYENTVAQIESENSEPHAQGISQVDLCTNLSLKAYDHWVIFQLKFTAGESLTGLANSLDQIVSAYQQYVEAFDELPDDQYRPPFIMNDLIDTYVDYLNILCVAILLRREDLIERIYRLNEGTDFEQADAVLEELMKFFAPDRPTLDYWLWDQPYQQLLDAIDSDTPAEMADAMKNYVKTWYPSMKGVAHFWGKHQQIKPEYTPYYGYWAMCAAAFTYLYEIDDASYRNETVYPKDLVDYARSIPRQDFQQKATTPPPRVAGNETCPKSGRWFTPAKGNSRAHFNAGDVMPDFPDAEYGLTTWQWMDN